MEKEKTTGTKDMPSPFLAYKGLPATEREFFARFGITKKKAKEILDTIAGKAGEANPGKGSFSHTRTWSKQNLEKLFISAGHDHTKLMLNISEYDFSNFAPDKFIKEACEF